MTGIRHTMLARLATLAALAAALGGCGSETSRPAADGAHGAPKATVTPDPAAGSFPARPQVVEKFSRPGSGWPRDGYREGAFVLPARGSAAVLAPQKVVPATRGTLSEVTTAAAEARRGGPAVPRVRQRRHGLRAAASAPTRRSSCCGSTAARCA